ncbi:MAGI3 family protein [Megaselia abdita]
MAVENDGGYSFKTSAPSVPASSSSSTPPISSSGIVAAAINSINNLTNNNTREAPSSPPIINNNILQHQPIPIASTSKSETSSNGSIKKNLILNRPPPLLHNHQQQQQLQHQQQSTGLINSSREDITSLGGGSSINSNQSIKGDGTVVVIPAPPTTGNGGIGIGVIGKELPRNPYYNGAGGAGGVSQMDDVDDDGLGPLPPKWEKAYTENGERYFIDHNSGSSHWLDPRLSKFQKKSLEDCLDDELPYGWEKIDDPQYGTYFIDHVNRKTQYENPVLQAKRRVDRNRLMDDSIQIQKMPIKPPPPKLAYTFTRNPSEMQGERITTTLLKSSRGLGITIIGGDDNIEEFLQIKSVVPNGPAWLDGKLQTGDILVYVNDTCVLGFTHHEMVNVFQSILPGETVTLEVCRGYPLPFDPNDPNTEVVTTIAVDGMNSDEKSKMFPPDNNYEQNPIAKLQSSAAPTIHSEINSELKKTEILTVRIVKGMTGFGFTIADSSNGQKVKTILDRTGCHHLQEGDLLLEINGHDVKHMNHSDVVQVLKDCPKTTETLVKIQRVHHINPNTRNLTFSGNKLRKSNKDFSNTAIGSGLFRSKTPTADLYSTQQKEILPIRPKTPLVDTRNRTRVKTPSNELNDIEVAAVTKGLENVSMSETKSITATDAKSNQSLDSINTDHIPYMDPYPKLLTSLTERLGETPSMMMMNESQLYHPHFNSHSRSFDSQDYGYGTANSNQLSIYAQHQQHQHHHQSLPAPIPTYHHENCYCLECQDFKHYQRQQQQQYQQYYHQNTNPMNIYGQQNGGAMRRRPNDLLMDRRKLSFDSQPLYGQTTGGNSGGNGNWNSTVPMQMPPQMQLNHHSSGGGIAGGGGGLVQPVVEDEYTLSEVTLERQALGFGFRIVGGTEEGSQVTVGHIVPGGAADEDHRVATGDEILSIDGVNVNSSHHKVVSLMGEAALRGQVTMILKRRVRLAPLLTPQGNYSGIQTLRGYPYDVIVSRHEHEGFGFVIISSSNQYYGSTIGKLIIGSPADRCGELKVGDRIIAVNRIDIAGMTHGDVVNLIKESGLHVRLTIGCPKEVGQPSPSQLQLTNNQPHQLLTTKSEPQQYYGPLHQQPMSQPQQIHPQL